MYSGLLGVGRVEVGGGQRRRRREGGGEQK